MLTILDTIFGWIGDIFSLLDRHAFDVVGFPVTLLDIAIGAIAMSMVIGLFWKGARG